MIVATFSMNSKMVIGLRSNDHLMFFSFIYLSIVCDTNHVHCDLIKIHHITLYKHCKHLNVISEYVILEV